ncbi:15652_t:CDS:2, partial [Racocetra fulgida]
MFSDNYKSKRKRQKLIEEHMWFIVNINESNNKQKTCIEKDTRATEAHVPLRVLEIDDKFNLSKEQYIDWLRPVNKTLANNALATFRDNI